MFGVMYLRGGDMDDNGLDEITLLISKLQHDGAEVRDCLQRIENVYLNALTRIAHDDGAIFGDCEMASAVCRNLRHVALRAILAAYQIKMDFLDRARTE